MPPEERASDVLIVGGGPAGMSLACALADGPLRVTLVERQPPGQRSGPDSGPGQRHCALALACTSVRILEELALWEELRSGAAPLRRVRISELGGCGGALLDAELLGLPALGYVLDAKLLGAALERRLDRAQNVSWLRPARLSALRPGAEHMEAVLQEGESGRETLWRTKLLVGADGAASRVRSLAGITWQEEDYGQTAVVSTLKLEQPHEDCAYEYFTPNGPLAIVPLTAGRCAVILGVPRERAPRFLGMSQGAFEAFLRRRLGGRLGRMRECGERYAYPLTGGRSGRWELSRLLLLGNAALAMHPHAAQGFNLVLRDLWTLAGLLTEAAARGEDPGADYLGVRYTRQRQAEQRHVALFSRGLVKLFYNRRPLTKAVRNLGLNLLDLSPGLQRFLLRRATGLHAFPLDRAWAWARECGT